jgi:hypothetical protein
MERHVAATAHARSIENTDARLDVERSAGELLKQAAKPKRDPRMQKRAGGCGVKREWMSGRIVSALNGGQRRRPQADFGIRGSTYCPRTITQVSQPR